MKKIHWLILPLFVSSCGITSPGAHESSGRYLMLTNIYLEAIEFESSNVEDSQSAAVTNVKREGLLVASKSFWEQYGKLPNSSNQERVKRAKILETLVCNHGFSTILVLPDSAQYVDIMKLKELQRSADKSTSLFIALYGCPVNWKLVETERNL